MSDAVSALQGVSSAGYVEVRETGLQGMITLRGDLSMAKVAKAVKSAVGVDMPAQRGINLKDCKGAAWMSPDELLLMVAYGDAEATVTKLQKALGASHSLVVNVSDARAVFTLRGERVREVVAKLSPVDMAAFATGEIRRTRLAQVPAAFWMSGGDEITLVVFRSVAQYAFDLLTTAAANGGEVEVF